VVDHRGKAGLFTSREGLLEVPRFSKKVFEQAAGFLRVPGGANPLDNTGVHPERYAALDRLAGQLGVATGALLGAGVKQVKEARAFRDEVGAFTFDDLVRELEKPGRDPRETFMPFAFRADIHELKDLQPGMVCPGIVTNVTNFGAFVDIGVHQDGLVHISQLADKFVKDPREVVSAGDRVSVRVLEVKLDKKQIALTMKSQSQSGSDARGERSAGGARPPDDGRRPLRDRGAPPPPPPKPTPFNNPFAALANRGKRS
jgi:uncharacterized protein